MAFLLCLSGCGKTQPTPSVPEEKQLPGTLVGVNYATGGGMAYRTEFSIRLTKETHQARVHAKACETVTFSSALTAS